MHVRKILFALLAIFLIGCAAETTVVRVTPQEPAQPQQPSAPAQNATAQQPVQPSQPSQPSGPSNKDLYLKDVLISTLYPDPGESFEVSPDIHNRGTEKIDKFDYTINIMKDGNIVKTDTIIYSGGLDVGEKTRPDHVYSFKDEGAYKVEVSVDAFNSINEFDETNNEITKTISINKPSNYTSKVQDSASMGTCTDSDGGKVYGQKGTCQDGASYLAPFADFCDTPSKLVELYCSNNRCQQEQRTCQCVSGICIS